jgi:hypothetical protein
MNFNFEEYVRQRDEVAKEYDIIDEILCKKTKEESTFPVSTYLGKSQITFSKSFLIVSH